jgi:hypothetical protein
MLIAPCVVSAYPTRDDIWSQYVQSNTQVVNTTPTVCPECPVCEKCSYSPKYTHERTYDVMVLDGIDISLVKRALYFIPNQFGYVLIPEDTTRYYIDKTNNTRPYNNQTNLIILFDPTVRDSRFLDGDQATFVSGGKNGGHGRIWIGIDKSKVTSDFKVGRLIFHECTHDLAPPGAYSKTGFPNIDNIGGDEFKDGSAYSSWKLHNGVDSVYTKLLYAVCWYWKNQNQSWGGVN